MQGQDHLYFLLDEMNRSLYVENGIVQRSATPRPLQFTPDGWRKIKVENQRNQKYFALDRMYTVPLEFVEDGAHILRYMKYTYGSEVKVYLGILKQKLFYDGAQFGYYHDKFIKGEIDFSNYVRSGPKVTVNIMEGGLAKLIKNRENVKYELDIDVPQAVKMKMDGTFLHASTKYVTQEGNTGGLHLPGWIFVNSEGANFAVQTQTVYLSAGSFNSATSDQWIIRNIGTEPISFNLKGSIKVRASANGIYIFGFETSGGTPFPVYVNNSFPGGVDTVIPYDINVTLQPDEKLFSVASWSNTLFLLKYVDVGEMSISFKSRYKTTFVKGLPPEYVYKKLIEKVTDSTYKGESPVLASNYNFVLTCGDALRGISGAKLKLSLADFFQSFNTQFDVGMGEISGKVRLDEKYTFIDYSNPIDLGEVSNFKDKPATDYYFSTLKIGYPEQDYDDVNGKQEFNNTNEYTTPITRVTKELNLVSAFRADCYGAEFTRINLEGKTTTDSDSDNDIWIIHTNKTSVIDPVEGQIYELNRDLNPFATGVLEPETIYNLQLSPRRCLDRNGRYIHSGFYKMDNANLIFQTTQKNSNLATSNPIVVEKSNVSVGSLLGRLFQPELLEFDTPAPVDLVELLEASPVRAFKGTYLGIPFDGIPIKVGIAASDFEAQTYTLLASPTMDFTPFIELVE